MPVKFGFALAVAFALAGCGSGGQSLVGALPAALRIGTAPPASTATSAARTSKERLYVASADPYFLNEYSLPLRSGEGPILSETNVSEPVPVFDDGSDLYVGSFDDGTIYVFPLPLSASLDRTWRTHPGAAPGFIEPLSRIRAPGLPQVHAGPGDIASGLGDLSGLTEDNGFLYVAGAGERHATVFAYRLPLTAGEKPSASISTFSVFDFLGIAAHDGTLFIASTIRGTVEAYPLPLGKRARPLFTIPTIPQRDGASGIAVDASGHHLYVSLYQTGGVYEYRLPYVSGERPKRLDVASQTGGLPYGIALDTSHLFVTANGIAAYGLPITSRSRPVTVLPFSGWATGIAAGR